MLTDEAVELFERGSALIVGLVGTDGAPLATRAWGMRIHPGRTTARVLVTARDVEAAAMADHPGGELTVTGACVATLRSAQAKGTVLAVLTPDDDDAACMQEYTARLVDDVSTVDGIPRYLVERLVPDAVLACEVELQEVYDQTPGPRAGAPLETGTPP